MALAEHTQALLSRLGYLDAPGYLSAGRVEHATEHAHIFRRAVSHLNLAGVYVLKAGQAEGATSTPLVYVATAESIEQADAIHRSVWNQNIVPFVLVQTPRDGTRLYAGFRYTRPGDATTRPDNILDVADSLDAVASKLEDLSSAAIRDGSIWRSRRDVIQPRQRVDWRLLDNLKTVGRKLTKARGLNKHVAHALIGKFVYLRYLRDRGILTDGRLAEWGLTLHDVLGRACRREAFVHLLECLDDWLNGSVFPLSFDGTGAPSEGDVRYVASVFKGDDALTGQIHFDFQAYDFSYIPIETLSVIYEQFLNIEGRQRSLGAYYTPIPLVNFVLAEVDDHVPLGDGTRILDPSCGSGAFLVQCYRRIVERELAREGRAELAPSRLRDLLTANIFGVDRDVDACRVSELSLVLTLLDYVNPPDLTEHPEFKLPALGGRNIFTADFFDPASDFEQSQAAEAPFDAVVGNPPWLSLSQKKLEDAPALAWVTANAKKRPVTNLQLAEAFAWKCLDWVGTAGAIGLILPAMSLYKSPTAFRRAFFSVVQAHAVADFSNMMEVLFAGRGRQPAVAITYSPRTIDTRAQHPILVFTPLIINQEANRPRPGRRMETWNITINRSEIAFLRPADAATGDPAIWKVTSYGSERDRLLLRSVALRVSSFGQVEDELGLEISQGPHLRDSTVVEEDVIPAPEFTGRSRVVTSRLTEFGRVFEVPPTAIEPVPEELDSVRARGGKRGPLAACVPPHILLTAGRQTAVFSEEFLVPRARQVGIAGEETQRALLIALTLFLNSDFLAYWEYLTAAQTGVYGGLGTLRSLRSVPCPLLDLDDAALERWGRLHDHLVDNSRRRIAEAERVGLMPDHDHEHNALMEQLNEFVYDALQLADEERWLVEDLVNVRRHTVQGKVSSRVVGAPTDEEISRYQVALCTELDRFLHRDGHTVMVGLGQSAGLVAIGLDQAESELPSMQQLDAVFERLHARSGQWLYFDRNLLVFDEGWSYFLKPAQRYWWTRSQALLDADRLIAESIGGA